MHRSGRIVNEAEIAELAVDASVAQPDQGKPFAIRAWSAFWPKLLAVGIVVAIWEIADPAEVEARLRPAQPVVTSGQVLWSEIIGDHRGPVTSAEQLALTMQRGLVGYGIAVADRHHTRNRRRPVASPAAGHRVTDRRSADHAVDRLVPVGAAVLRPHREAILFVVVLGAAPSIAAGVIAGIDEVPPPLLRAGKMIGATGINKYRYITLPAAMPAYLMGLKQGWAFAWRSLLAGELLVPIGGATSLGAALFYSRQVTVDAPSGCSP